MKLKKNHIAWYCIIEDLVNKIDAQLIADGRVNRRGRKPVIPRAYAVFYQILKIELGFTTTFTFYLAMQDFLQTEHGKTISYQQFNATLQQNTFYLFAALSAVTQYNRATNSGYFAIDSTVVPICDIGHAKRSKIGKGSAKIGHSGKKFFYGYKLHGVIDMVTMRLMSFKMTPANVSDIKALDEKMVAKLAGVLVGDKGYISAQKNAELLKKQLRLLTPVRKNMKQAPISTQDLVLLRQRNRIESTWGTLKNNWQLINRYARCIESFFNQLFASILGYSLKKFDDQRTSNLTSLIS